MLKLVADGCKCSYLGLQVGERGPETTLLALLLGFLVQEAMA